VVVGDNDGHCSAGEPSGVFLTTVMTCVSHTTCVFLGPQGRRFAPPFGGPGPHVLCLSKAGPKALDGGVVMSLCRSFGKPPFHYGCWGSILCVLGVRCRVVCVLGRVEKESNPPKINRIPPLKGRAPHLVFQHRSATSTPLNPRIDLRLLLVTGKVTTLNEDVGGLLGVVDEGL
jgi:hypothetical protein